MQTKVIERILLPEDRSRIDSKLKACTGGEAGCRNSTNHRREGRRHVKAAPSAETGYNEGGSVSIRKKRMGRVKETRRKVRSHA